MHQKITLLLFFSYLCCFSQDFKVTGFVKDANTNAIEFANVLLVSQQDESIVQGTTTNATGFFSLDQVPEGAYTLKISFIGYDTFTSPLQLNTSLDLNAIELKESSETLDAINIVGKRPTFKKQPDRIIFNIEQTSLTEGSILDVLKNTPGILIMNDEISVKNSSLSLIHI